MKTPFISPALTLIDLFCEVSDTQEEESQNPKKRTRTESQRVPGKQSKIRRVERHLSQSKAVIPTFTLTSMLVTRTKTTTTITTVSTPPAMPNPPALVVMAAPAKYCSVCRKQPCQSIARAIQFDSLPESDWSGKDWDRDRQREHEIRKKEQQEKEEEERIRQKDTDSNYPPSPIYDPSDKEDTSAHMCRKDLDPNYYPPNYQEDTPIVTDDLVQKLNPGEQRRGPTRRRKERKRRITTTTQ